VIVLLLLSIVLPWVAILCSQLFMRFREVENMFSNDMSKSQLGLFQSIFICSVFTNFIKVFVGKPRPNFFALCDYHGILSLSLSLSLSLFLSLSFFLFFVSLLVQNFFEGYRNAVLTNNYTEYNNLTTFGHQVHIDSH